MADLGGENSDNDALATGGPEGGENSDNDALATGGPEGGADDSREAPGGPDDSDTEADGTMALGALPPETVAMVLAWAGPRAIKRFGATCGLYRKLSRWYVAQREYGLLLVRSARHQVKREIARRHADCCKDGAGDFNARAEHHADYVVAKLAGCAEGRAPQTALEILRFLYPAAVLARSDWELAPFAFEWCALAERRATGAGVGPRRELLALLHGDPFTRLAAAARKARWPLGASCAETAGETCALASLAAYALSVMSGLVLEAALEVTGDEGPDRAVFCFAFLAAAERQAERHEAFGSWRCLRSLWAAGEPDPPRDEGRLPQRAGGRRYLWGAGGHRDLREAPPACLGESAGAWRELAGLTGAGRDPREWTAEFVCSAWGHSGAGGAPGPRPVVPVADAGLAGLLAHAARAGAAYLGAPAHAMQGGAGDGEEEPPGEGPAAE